MKKALLAAVMAVFLCLGPHVALGAGETHTCFDREMFKVHLYLNRYTHAVSFFNKDNQPLQMYFNEDRRWLIVRVVNKGRRVCVVDKGHGFAQAVSK